MVNILQIDYQPDGNYAASGTGFFTRSDGIITTAAHVILKNGNAPQGVAEELYVHVYPENVILPATVIGVDRLYDVAVLKVNVGALPARSILQWGDSRDTHVGDFAITIGQPYGQHVQSVTFGVVRDNKFHDDSSIPESMVVDFHTVGGNSGGPVIDYEGNVIGILSWGLQDVSAGYDFSLNGSISSHVAEQIYTYIVTQYDVSPMGPLVVYPTGFLGVEYSPVNTLILRQQNITNLKVEGVFINSVRPSSPASVAGLVAGDIITTCNDVIVGHGNNQYPLGTLIHFQNPGGQVVLKIRRATNYNLEVTLPPITLSTQPPTTDFIFSPLQSFQQRKMITTKLE